ncbi:MBL fold metallo-hydrolase [Clostridium rectalis]|uniref:MBL fold metallo-hydrolase n=1 Tax=Clostridium rectalis TaxID=2040295 RepID=UPI000F62FF1B|nr:MBL fold metallo-hydrolase [Clostridium rectalis]
MKIISLMDNLKGNYNNLYNEHGLSLYIEKDNKKILFDTGRSDKFIYNASILGVSLKDIDAVIISHGHCDHGGGLNSFLKLNSKAKIYIKRECLKEYYFKVGLFRNNISISKKVFQEYSDRIIYIDNLTQILNGVYIITDIQKYYDIPRGNKYLKVKEKGKLIQDDFNHELIMVIKEKSKACVFTGCSHNGVINMVRTVKENFRQVEIKVLIGGFHLVKLPAINFYFSFEKSIIYIINMIIDQEIEKIYTAHCTGEKSYKRFKSILKDKIEYIKLGEEINIRL